MISYLAMYIVIHTTRNEASRIPYTTLCPLHIHFHYLKYLLRYERSSFHFLSDARRECAEPGLPWRAEGLISNFNGQIHSCTSVWRCDYGRIQRIRAICDLGALRRLQDVNVNGHAGNYVSLHHKAIQIDFAAHL
jgi:hypothetical protein